MQAAHATDLASKAAAASALREKRNLQLEAALAQQAQNPGGGGHGGGGDGGGTALRMKAATIDATGRLVTADEKVQSFSNPRLVPLVGCTVDESGNIYFEAVSGDSVGHLDDPESAAKKLKALRAAAKEKAELLRARPGRRRSSLATFNPFARKLSVYSDVEAHRDVQG